MKVKAVGFVAIPVTDLKRARAFYEGVLDLEVAGEMMGGKWVEYEAGETTLALASLGTEWVPSDQGTAAALEVEDFDEAIRKLKVAVIRFAAEPFETPCCHMAVVQDPDGNKVIIHKLKPGEERGDCT
ncbi:MAG: VOC family protein [Chthoniobacterales bacterium]